MTLTRRLGLSSALAAATLLVAPLGHAQEQTFVTIGTGGVTGVYYPTGGAIARLVNRNRSEHGIRASVESTAGSVYNVNAVHQGELQFGVAQSDVQANAYQGNPPFDTAYEDIRAVFSVHPEPLTVVARRDASISSFDELQGKRVNIGNPGSGQRALMDVIMNQYGWDTDSFALASELKPAEQSQALGDNKVDAIIYTVGHPNGSIQEATTVVDAALVPVEGESIDALVNENSYYAKTEIPGGMYNGNEEPTQTFGVRATFVTSTQVSEDVVYEVTKAVFENFEDFKSLHPAFANLTKDEMVSDALTAPLHPGAERYYQEAGLL